MDYISHSPNFMPFSTHTYIHLLIPLMNPLQVWFPPKCHLKRMPSTTFVVVLFNKHTTCHATLPHKNFRRLLACSSAQTCSPMVQFCCSVTPACCGVSIGARTSTGLHLSTELQHMRDVSKHVVPGAHITSLTLINFLRGLYSFELFSCATHYCL